MSENGATSTGWQIFENVWDLPTFCSFMVDFFYRSDKTQQTDE